MLVTISSKFAELTRGAKQKLDEVKDKSVARKKQYGVLREIDGVDSVDEKPKFHHRKLPAELMKKLKDAVREVGSISLL